MLQLFSVFILYQTFKLGQHIRTNKGVKNEKDVAIIDSSNFSP